MFPSLTRLFSRLRAHRRAVALGTALTLLGSAAGVVQPLAAREVLEAVAEDRSVLGWVGALLVIVVLASVANMLGTFVMERTAEGVVRDARRAIARRILLAPVLQVGRHAGGDLVSRVVADTTLLRGSAGQALSGVVGGMLTVVVSLAMMATIDVVLLGATLAVIVMLGAMVGVLLPRIARDMTASQEAVGALAGRMEPVVRHLRTVKSNGEEDREQHALDMHADEAYAGGVRAARARAIVMAGGDASIQIAFLIALGLGGARAASGAISVPDLIAFLLYLMLLVAPVVLVVAAVTELQNAIAADTRLRPLEALAAERTTEPTAATVVGAGPLIAMEDVTVHAGDREILKGVTLALPAGGVTGIVGPSGSGKTTLLELLCAFRVPNGGVVRVGGRPLAQWPLRALRQELGYVEQDAPIMPGTLAENLRYGAPEASTGALERVLASLGLDRLIEGLPDGLETMVGPGGRPLSGGERQRVAIARALLRRPRVLLLDEASSQLDARADAALRRAVAVAARECTVIVVAHRLATVLQADRIVVLEAGRVRAVGTHAQLCAGDELYRSLAAEQGLLAHAA
ncbi:MAG TPA: ABC transporter ATP-binding protein [Solirubrobacteraceae bacterium]|nr:ABC transporter ATP-binding protein [Solirubrobacteraceae bacterium]